MQQGWWWWSQWGGGRGRVVEGLSWKRTRSSLVSDRTKTIKTLVIILMLINCAHNWIPVENTDIIPVKASELYVVNFKPIYNRLSRLVSPAIRGWKIIHARHQSAITSHHKHSTVKCLLYCQLGQLPSVLGLVLTKCINNSSKDHLKVRFQKWKRYYEYIILWFSHQLHFEVAKQKGGLL